MFSAFSNFELQIFGTSHSEEIGVIMSGLPSGYHIDLKMLQAFVDRRKSGNNPWSTPRKEDDLIQISSGLSKDGMTNGKDFKAIIKNHNIMSKDYDNVQFVPRPSHADYVARVKFGDKYDHRGGGKFSGRMTAPLTIVGGIAKQILKTIDVEVLSFINNIGGIKALSFVNSEIKIDDILKCHNYSLPVLDKDIIPEMIALIEKAKERGDSVGGSIECMTFGLPVGLGDSLFEGLEGRLSASIFGIPSIKAVEFGLGIGFAKAFGKDVNDEFAYENDKIITLSNNNGGINGGISNGMPVSLRATIKPTPSILSEQKSVDMIKRHNTILQINGRHDACIVPRALAPIESAVALTLLDASIDEKIIKNGDIL